jgi:hypothetical protein
MQIYIVLLSPLFPAPVPARLRRMCVLLFDACVERTRTFSHS